MSVHQQLLEHVALAARGSRDTTRRRILEAFDGLLGALRRVALLPGAPAGARRKAAEVLDLLAAREAEYGPRFMLPAFLLNFVGEAMVRVDFIHDPIVEFLKTGLYFYGIEYIERRLRPQAAEYMALQVDVAERFFSREALLALVASGRERLEAGRPFCVVHAWVNGLRRAFWAWRRVSADAMDAGRARNFDGSAAEATGEAPQVPSRDRVLILLGIFERDLTALQRAVYLAKHGTSVEAAAPARDADADPVARWIEAFARGGDDEEESGADSWADVARRLSVSPKTAKREYLRALQALLRESHRAVFGAEPPLGVVRRVLRTLQSVIDAKDLRIRDAAGQGLAGLVATWELALRWVFNHSVQHA